MGHGFRGAVNHILIVIVKRNEPALPDDDGSAYPKS
jgi:hypothetical protein